MAKVASSPEAGLEKAAEKEGEAGASQIVGVQTVDGSLAVAAHGFSGIQKIQLRKLSGESADDPLRRVVFPPEFFHFGGIQPGPGPDDVRDEDDGGVRAGGAEFAQKFFQPFFEEGRIHIGKRIDEKRRGREFTQQSGHARFQFSFAGESEVDDGTVEEPPEDIGAPHARPGGVGAVDDAAAVIDDLPARLRRVPTEKALRRDARGDARNAVAEGEVEPETPPRGRETPQNDLLIVPGKGAQGGGEQPSPPLPAVKIQTAVGADVEKGLSQCVVLEFPADGEAVGIRLELGVHAGGIPAHAPDLFRQELFRAGGKPAEGRSRIGPSPAEEPGGRNVMP